MRGVQKHQWTETQTSQTFEVVEEWKVKIDQLSKRQTQALASHLMRPYTHTHTPHPLRLCIADAQDQADVQEVGRVLSVGDGIARIYGLKGVKARADFDDN